MIVKCKQCNKKFEVSPSVREKGKGKYCSKECYGKSISGKNCRFYKDGRTKREGYVFLKKKDHPKANCNGYIKRSRLVMEDKLGRTLNRKEKVHHINGDKKDDRPENLEVLTNSEHTKKHIEQGDIDVNSYEGKDSREKFTCDLCGKKFKRYRSLITSDNVFCSKECKNKAYSVGILSNV